LPKLANSWNWLEVKTKKPGKKPAKPETPPVVVIDLVSSTHTFPSLDKVAQYTFCSSPISIMLLQNQMKPFSRYCFIEGLKKQRIFVPTRSYKALKKLLPGWL
jgi:hypothetical protein